MKKIVISLLVLILSFVSNFGIVLAEETGELTFKDYDNAIQEAGKLYGVDVWVNDYDALGEITQEKIDDAVETIKNFAETAHVEEHTENEVTTPSIRRASKASRTRNGYFDIVAGAGMATIKVVINATIETETYLISSINSKTAYQEGVSLCFSSWTTKRISTTQNYRGNGKVLAEVTGYAVFNYGVTSLAQNMTGSCVIDFRS